MMKFYRLCGLVLYPILLPLMRLFLRRTSRVYVALIYENEVLLVKNWLARDTWRLPGGGIGHNESPEQAALREIREELRVVLAQNKLSVVCKGIQSTDRLGFEYSIYAYRCTDKPRILPNKYEIIDVQWCDIADVHGTIPEVLSALKDTLRQDLN